ncbi:hypothetical protein EIP91_006056 [Steccherinum ochraceum]|uniref:Xylanolytic transcriptional activator regulatory domain-containing protein n=1 Tax=Steccherinum ochraceum TaxID=92696 RepID=A0A4R0R932_9APHY|nr:hypothetical protein EIP91_006056 [Steccherinum ochraceum]
MEREYDCEYTDGPVPSLTQLLERDVARLQARIKELEADPQRTASRNTAGSSSTSPNLSTAIVLASSSSSSIIPADPGSEVHQAVIGLLIGIFVPHASQVGFFLNISRFLDAAYLPSSETRQSALSPALLDCVLLWGAHFSNNRSLKDHEATLLNRAVMSLASGSSLQNGTIQTIQAEILLANYFFCQSRMLEGTYHCSAAVALALSCRLNRIRSAEATVPLNLPTQGILALSPPHDLVEEGERINAFWTAYILDRGWSVAQGSHANDVFLGVQIDTPWPQEMGSYEEGDLPAELRSLNTIAAFLNEPAAGTPYDAISTIALRAKAATLFERATRLASQWTHGLLPFLDHGPLESDQLAASLPPAMPDFDGFYVQVFRLDAVLRSFTASLLALDRPEVAGNVELGAHLLVTHTYVYAAIIRLHTHLEAAMTGYEERHDLRAAKQAADAIDMVQLTELPFLDPILAILWGVIGKVFIDSIRRLSDEQLEQKQALVLYLGKVINAMALYAHTSILIAAQLAQIQADLAALNVPAPAAITQA